MSALPLKADMFSVEIDVCFVPIADISVSIHDTLCGNNPSLIVVPVFRSGSSSSCDRLLLEI
jgi:hypothetical protein